MSRVCELTGVSVQSGHNVSHSQRKISVNFYLIYKMYLCLVIALKRLLNFKVAARAMKTLDKVGD
ncbi:ribosomal L28 family protein [Orientia tsutsugamushi str. Gilliam]|uniref:Ribosomal L28 family protein n=1 Tax=Orientia tsutsugamushi str. Gilliam TaxID=1359184 RepID=A0A0F3M6D3_ORITS|nr:L28 family ribosomal protein [Orientia tsutsugamushi]KJV51310.1 ribosomal L28 family protein [Orientia tsutsugamushi str. Gilliam]